MQTSTKFQVEIQELLHIPRIIFVLLSHYTGIVKLTPLLYKRIVKELDQKWLEYFSLMLAGDLFLDSSPKDRAAKLILTYGCIKEVLTNSLNINSRSITQFLKNLDGKTPENNLNLIKENSDCISLLKEVQNLVNNYIDREDGFYKEFYKVSTSVTVNYGVLFMKEQLYKSRHLN